MKPDQKRALSDYRCACRKLVTYLREQGAEEDAEWLECQMAGTVEMVETYRDEEKES